MVSPGLWTWLAAGFLVLGGSGYAQVKNGRGPLFGQPAPAFHVQGIFNESYSLETFKGRILVLEFGASW
jgi:hypothetical protein